MTATSFDPNALSDARSALASAHKSAETRRSDLFTMLYHYRDSLPEPVRAQLARVDAAEHAVGDRQADVIIAARAHDAAHPERAAKTAELHRISTLVAKYVVGSRIITANPTEAFPHEWQIEAGESRKRRPVPDYARNLSLTMTVERTHLPADRLDAYSMHIAREVSRENNGEASPAAIAGASALARARAMLRAVGVDPDSATVSP